MNLKEAEKEAEKAYPLPVMTLYQNKESYQTAKARVIDKRRAFVEGIGYCQKQKRQSEADLDNEIEKYFKGWTETDEGIACHYQYVDLNTCHSIAHHFYELGLNARKED